MDGFFRWCKRYLMVGACFLTATMVAGETVLPIEVMNLSLYTETLVLELPGVIDAGKLVLEALVHNVAYRDKGLMY